uniref:SagB/ThcOx family dehydrogenase n=1 Tax=Ignisphaera aggregans TaxID=334771 RepID=A0A7C4NN81_9CREN
MFDLEAITEVFLPYPCIRKGVLSVEEAIAYRRSIRSFKREPISLDQLSQILWALYGVTDPDHRFLATPSAGATYPLEVYVVIGDNAVKDLNNRYLDAGVYRYDNHAHKLDFLISGDLREELYKACLHQSWVRDAAVNIVMCAAYERTTSYYGERGYRYVHFEVGHAGQNVYLMATALGLGTVAIGAFKDLDVKRILKLPPNVHPLYIMPVGVPTRSYTVTEKELTEYINEHRIA